MKPCPYTRFGPLSRTVGKVFASDSNPPQDEVRKNFTTSLPVTFSTNWSGKTVRLYVRTKGGVTYTDGGWRDLGVTMVHETPNTDGAPIVGR